MGYGLWAMVCGLWAMDYGLWSMGYGPWSMVYGLWSMGYGLWSMGYGLWALGYGLWATMGYYGLQVKSYCCEPFLRLSGRGGCGPGARAALKSGQT
eukprot:4515897-Pyramimonas_sp.AAC.1